MEGKITETNSAARQMFGYLQEEITRKRDIELIRREYVSDYENFKEQVRPSCKLRLFSQGLKKNGSTFHSEIYCTTFTWESQEYMLTLVRDVTNRRRAEETIDNTNRELKKVNDLLMIQNSALSRSRATAIEMLEQAKRAKVEIEQIDKKLKSAAGKANITSQSVVAAAQVRSNFPADMAHEVRTPMNAIIGFTDSLMGDQISTAEKEYLQIIQNCGSSLIALINDILDFSKIEAGKLDIETLPTPIKGVIDSIGAMLRPMAEAKGLTFKAICDNSIPETVETDPVRLQQCLINLLSNAIKFTEKGHVHLQATVEVTGDKKWMRFEVEDTGIGIPADKQLEIFDFFSQADTDTARHFGGTGFGLAITKRLTELLGGKVSVASEPGEGTTFTMMLPMENSKQSRCFS
jgi:PAS domain S-box-containing protein